MEVQEALSRLVVRHAWLIAITVAVGLVVGVALALSTATTYQATARFQAAVVPPSSDTEAAAVSDRIKGIATSPQVVRGAIADAGVDRVAAKVVHAITVTRVGSSAIVDVSVSDHDRGVALALSRSLANRVAPWIDRTPHQALAPVLADIDSLSKAISTATTRLTNADPARGAQLADSQSDLQTARQQLLADEAQAANATVVSLPDTVSASGDRISLLVPLGILAGLLVGLLLAAAHETLRPTIGAVAALARELQAPLLGRLPAEELPASVVANVLLAAKQQEVKHIIVIGTVDPARLQDVQQRLSKAVIELAPIDWWAQQTLTGTNGHGPRNGHVERPVLAAVGDTTRAGSPAVAVEPDRHWSSVGWPSVAGARSTPAMTVELMTPDVARSLRPGTGLLVVAERFARVEAVDALRDVRLMSGCPVIGVVDAGAVA